MVAGWVPTHCAARHDDHDDRLKRSAGVKDREDSLRADMPYVQK